MKSKTEPWQQVSDSGTEWHLFLDDVRWPSKSLTDSHHTLIVCRSSAQALDLIKERGCPVSMHLDHDLGDGDDVSSSFYPSFEAMVLDGEVSLPSNFAVHVHSMNPVGSQLLKDKMGGLIQHMKEGAVSDRIDTAKEREKLAELEGYSQGPWKVRESLDGTPKLDSRDGYTVDRDDPTAGKPFVVSSWRLQNARLIAAAPDLHAHLTAALDEIERLREALSEMTDICGACPFDTIYIRGQYVDREEAVQ